MSTEAATKLAEQLDGAKLVDYRPEIELVFAWFGGHGVNVYNARTGREEHYFNVGSFAENSATRSEVEMGIEGEVAQMTSPLRA